jgi:hypothetical protein
MYVLIKNGVVETYPYSIGNLRKDNPNVSFPRTPNETLLTQWGVFPVRIVPAPSQDYTKNITEGSPENVDGWRQTWVVTDATTDEIAQRTQAQADGVRNQRNQSLSESDWTQVADAPVDKAAWATYRQALRDVTQQAGFPWDVQWPVAP